MSHSSVAPSACYEEKPASEAYDCQGNRRCGTVRMRIVSLRLSQANATGRPWIGAAQRASLSSVPFGRTSDTILGDTLGSDLAKVSIFFDKSKDNGLRRGLEGHFAGRNDEAKQRRCSCARNLPYAARLCANGPGRMQGLRYCSASRSELSAVAVAVGVLPLAAHLLTSTRYGYFRDEFYYIAC